MLIEGQQFCIPRAEDYSVADTRTSMEMALGDEAKQIKDHTGRRIYVFGFNLNSQNVSISGALQFGFSLNRSWRLTEALVGPSWVDVPLTLKLTPLGALDLTSILASDNRKLYSVSLKQLSGCEYQLQCGRSLCSRAVDASAIYAL